MEPITINCPCGYGNNLTSENKNCPICGLNLEPLHRIYALPAGYYEKAVSLFRGHDFENAKQYFMTCLSLSESVSPELYVYLGKCFLETKEMSSAEKYLQLAASQDPGNPEVIRIIHDLMKKKKNNGLFKGAMISLLVVFPAICIFLLFSTGSARREVRNLEQKLAVRSDITITWKDTVTVKEPKAVTRNSYSIPYYVRPGETLSLISFSFYGNENSWKKIFNANKDKIQDPDILEKQTVIIIPLDTVFIRP